ncbi:glycosyltransferase [Glutamicibacter sp. PS]|uniref:glycosyltransferase n=1 Tax=Glutamicibacter sp. PS TaxID=3075634 RepID=UPI0028421EC2|nr:glycosyltransferase [Glutamicibacter sp. PS]MDR4533020.1 glycosyltransferase [Glutamicibacter sp. PS]
MTNADLKGSPLSGLTLLCVVDYETKSPGIYFRWLTEQLDVLIEQGADLAILHPSGDAAGLPESLKSLDCDIILGEDFSSLEPLERSRKLAQVAVSTGQSEVYDHVLGFGWTLCRGVAGGKQLKDKFWAFIDDFESDYDRTKWTNSSVFESLVLGSRRLTVFTEEKRALVETSSSSACGKTYLPIMDRVSSVAPSWLASEDRSTSNVVHLSGLVDPRLYLYNLASLSEQIKMGSIDATYCFEGTREEWLELQADPSTAIQASVPGTCFHVTRDSFNVDLRVQRVGIVPDTVAEDWQSVFIAEDFSRRSIRPILLSELLGKGEVESMALKSMLFGQPHAKADSDTLRLLPQKVREIRMADAFGVSPLNLKLSAAPKVVLAGADFKFAGDLVELLSDSKEFSLRIDLWDNNSTPQPSKSQPFLDWADIVVCEFASFNAIWYSENKKSSQKLIVRLHGYELLQPWISRLRLENVDHIVFVSEFYRQKAIVEHGWPASKTTVISNTVNFADLTRSKLPGSEFHLGLAGYVPILKRPDRALDLLETLLEQDERFILHLRGHYPWNYSWEWKKQAHQAAYRDFYRRIGSSELLSGHVSFEPFGADMASWFRKIGWMLSPSYRETFHLAPVEGMASGSLPIVWNRTGASDIFPEEFVFDDTANAASLILETIGHAGSFPRRTARVRDFATKYSRSEVNAAWTELLGQVLSENLALPNVQDIEFSLELSEALDTHEKNSSKDTLLEVVRGAWEQEEYSVAISLLDENIKLTANDNGELKKWEHWVRGIFQTAMNLDSIVPLSSQGTLYDPRPGSVAFVGTDQTSCEAAGFSRGDADIKFVRVGSTLPRQEHIRDHSGTFFDLDVDESVVFDGSLRTNYYIALVASDLASFFKHNRIEVAVAGGGLIESLATLIAARRVGVPFVWNAPSSPECSSFLGSHRQLTNDNPVHEIYSRVLAGADALLGGRERLEEVAREQGIQLFREFADLRGLVSRKQRVNRPDLDTELHSPSIVYVGSGASLPNLSLYCDVKVVDPTEISAALDEVPDVLLFEYGSVDSNRSKLVDGKQLLAAETLKTLQALVIRARMIGTRSVFVSRSDPETLALGKELARKCDVVCSNDRKSLISYMRLNPNSNQIALNCSAGSWPDLLPNISLVDSPNIVVGSSHGDASSNRAGALAKGKPFITRWVNDGRWCEDSKHGREDFAVLYEQHRNQDLKVRALWEDLDVFAQGLTGHDEAVYLLRSLGYAVTHHRAISAAKWLASDLDFTKEVRLDGLEVLVNCASSTDTLLRRDIANLIRVSDFCHILVSDREDGTYQVTATHADGPSIELGRVIEVTDHRDNIDFDFESKGISIVLATYRGVTRLPKLLSSIQQQSMPLDLIELVAVPNGEDDGSLALLRSWAVDSGLGSVQIHPQNVAGVANARNVGISSAKKEFIVFADDDDFFEPNYLLSLYSRADESTVVLGRLSDVDEDSGLVNRDTPTTRRVDELDGRRLPLGQRAGALGMNGAKLLPSAVVKDCYYESSLKSGEDVAFMAQLLKRDGLSVVSASALESADYMRVLRSNSISRRDEDFEFMVVERLQVLSSLLKTRAETSNSAGKGAINYLAAGQIGFIKRYISTLRETSEFSAVLDAINAYGVSSDPLLKQTVEMLNSAIQVPRSVRNGQRVKITEELDDRLRA